MTRTKQEFYYKLTIYNNNSELEENNLYKLSSERFIKILYTICSDYFNKNYNKKNANKKLLEKLLKVAEILN